MLEALKPVAERFKQGGHSLYLVGGSVRNPLLGLPVSDTDLCGDATPQEVQTLLKGTDIQIYPQAPHLGTLLLVWHGGGQKHQAEYTTFRQDSYRGGHVPARVDFTRDIRVDALRRDFRVNALYQDALTGALADPLGGLEDIPGRVLRTVTQDPHEVLKDDGLRLMRMVRLGAQLRFRPAADLWEEAVRQVGLLREIAVERLKAELDQTLTCDTRYPALPGGSQALGQALSDLQALGAMPLLFSPAEPTQDGVALCAAVAGLSTPSTKLPPTGDAHNPWMIPNPYEGDILALRLGALFYGHDGLSIQRTLSRLRFSTDLVSRVGRIVDRPGQEMPLLEAVARAGAQTTWARVQLLWAMGQETQGDGLLEALHVLAQVNAPRRPSDMRVDGAYLRTLLGDAPVRWMTPLLDTLWVHVLHHPEDNRPEQLENRAACWIADRIKEETP